MIIDLLLLAVIGVVTWCVASEGAWGAGQILLAVLFSGLMAMNLFEPLAGLLEGMAVPAHYADVIALGGLFAGFVFLLRFLFEYLCPADIELPEAVYQGGRWIFALLTGYVTMAILLTALHTAPLPREFLGFKPERKNLFDFAAPDRQWLGFTQYVSERIFYSGRVFDGGIVRAPTGEAGQWPEYWSSFPIRYASRRGAISRTAASGASSTLKSSAAGSDEGDSKGTSKPSRGF